MIGPLVNNNNNNKVKQFFSIFTLNVREREREKGLGVLKYIKRVKRDVQSFDIKLESLSGVRNSFPFNS